MLQIIKIEEANYKKYCNLDIVAFSYAKAGACGDGGSVCIIDINGQIYYTNYADLHAKLKYKHLLKVVPTLKDCIFNSFDHLAPEGWVPFYLGLGNHLTLKSIYHESFKSEMEKRGVYGPPDLYVHWPGMVLSILSHTQSDITLREISEGVEKAGTIDKGTCFLSKIRKHIKDKFEVLLGKDN